MIVFGVGASTCPAECEELAVSRLTEVTVTAVPAGTRTGAANTAGRIPRVARRSSPLPTRTLRIPVILNGQSGPS